MTDLDKKKYLFSENEMKMLVTMLLDNFCDNRMKLFLVEKREEYWNDLVTHLKPVDGFYETLAPVWYTKQIMHDWLIQQNYSKEIAEQLSDRWSDDLQRAFKKGWEKAFNDKRTMEFEYVYYSVEGSKNGTLQSQLLEKENEIVELKADYLRKIDRLKEITLATDVEALKNKLSAIGAVNSKQDVEKITEAWLIESGFEKGSYDDDIGGHTPCYRKAYLRHREDKSRQNIMLVYHEAFDGYAFCVENTDNDMTVSLNTIFYIHEVENLIRFIIR